MKNISFVLLLIFILACEKQNTQEINSSDQIIIPKVSHLKSSKDIYILGDTVYLKDKKFSGYLFDLYPNLKDTMVVEGYLDGLLNGLTRKWFENKILMEERNYLNGKKNGKKCGLLGKWKNEVHFHS